MHKTKTFRNVKTVHFDIFKTKHFNIVLKCFCQFCFYSDYLSNSLAILKLLCSEINVTLIFPHPLALIFK